MYRKKGMTLVLSILLLSLSSCKNEYIMTSWDSIFQSYNVTGTFVLKNLSTQKVYVFNRERSQVEYVPASTFKILNSMIALQVSAIPSVDDTLKWDGIDRGYKGWNKDHSMRSAMPVSCVWFYQNLARKIGKEQMQAWIIKSDYGNKKIENKIDRFWLDGNLRISAKEYIPFLERLVKNTLPFDKDIQEAVKEIMITDSTDSYTLHSKTGWSQHIGWNVGYIETKKDTWVFAMNIDMNSLKQAKARAGITYEILRREKIID